MLPAGGRDTHGYMISSGKVTNRHPNFDWKDFPGEGHLNQDLKDKKASTRQLGGGRQFRQRKKLVPVLCAGNENIQEMERPVSGRGGLRRR